MFYIQFHFGGDWQNSQKLIPQVFPGIAMSTSFIAIKKKFIAN